MHRLIYLLISATLSIQTVTASAQSERDRSNQIAPPQPCNDLNQLNWLLGQWQSVPNANTLEHWKKLSDDTYWGLGSSKDQQGHYSLHEDLRIVEMQSSLFYLAKVSQNQLPVAFKAIECHPNKVVFENLAHDFPTRLVYLTIDNTLLVEVSGKQSAGFTVHFVRQKVSDE